MAHDADTPQPGALPEFCLRCSAPIRPGRGEHYEVLVVAVADPHPPVLTEEDLQQDLDQQWRELLSQVEHLSAQEAQNQVYRRVQFPLCQRCFRQWIEDPTGHLPS